MTRSEFAIWTKRILDEVGALLMTLSETRKNPRWGIVLPALLIPCVASFFYFIWFPGTILGKSIYVGVKLFTLIWPFLAVLVILRERFSDDLRPRKHIEGLVWGGVFGVVTFAVIVGLYRDSPAGDLIRGNGHLIVQKIEDLGVKNYFIGFAIFISFFHSALEEFFWRYFAFGQLRKLVSIGWAVLIAAVGFSLHHIVVLSQYTSLPMAVLLGACVGLGGAVWSVIYHRTNSLWGAWLSHMIIDLAIMWVGWDILKQGS